MKTRILSLFLIFVLLFSSLMGCSNSTTIEGSATVSLPDKNCPYDEFLVVDVFNSFANFQGLQSGWFAEIVKKKFNMELNIIAPNVTGGFDTLYEMRSAAGNLGDLIICSSENGKLQNMVNNNLILDMKDMLKKKDIMQYESIISELNSPISSTGIYAIPSEISTLSPTTPSESFDLVYGPYLRWDIYASLGYPKMETLEDLLPVLDSMQEACPLSDSGEKTYAFSLFRDWDGNFMNNAKQPCCLYGYDEMGFVLAKADGSDYQSIIDNDSMYMRVLRFFYDANQLGLVDPASTTQNYDTVFKKFQDGAVLYSFWPWLGQSAYNTLEHVNEGKGFMFANIDDMEVFSYGSTVVGNQKSVIAIGSQAKDPQRLADFIDWLYSPEGITSSSGHTAGPEGVTWEMTEDGPVLTDLGVEALLNGDSTMPEELGGGLYSEGTSALNYTSIAKNESDPNGYPYNYKLWDSVQQMEKSPLEQDWRSRMDANNTIEYLYKNDMIIVAPGCDFATPAESTEVITIRNQCRKIIVDLSWKMIFAQNQDEFNSLKSEMQNTVLALGYEKILALDMENAKAQDSARKEATKSTNLK